METSTGHVLGRIAYTEQVLARLIEESTGSIGDPDFRTQMEAAARRHRQHVDDILGIQGVDLPNAARQELAEERETMERQVRHARGLDGLMNALAELEREEDDRLREALAEEHSREVREVLENVRLDIAEDLRTFMDQSAGMAPGIPDPRTSP